MAIRIRVNNKTKGTTTILPPNTSNYTASLGDGTYSFEPVLSLPEEFVVVGADPAPVNLNLPGAVGVASEGETVKGTPGVWDGAVTVVAQWMDGNSPVGAEGYDLSVLRSLGGETLILREAATNPKGTTYADSLPIGPITTSPQFTTQPALSGTPTAGQAMTATAGVASGFPAPQVTGRIERQLGTTGEVSVVEGGMSSVFVSGYRYRPAATASNSVQTVEAFGSWTAVVAATVAPLAAGANLPKQTIIQNSGTAAIAADSLFTGNVDTYALVSPPSGFTINATTGAISVNTASLALRTDETITVRASNDTPATLDRTFVIEVVNASGTATVPGAVTLGTVTIATGSQPGTINVTNVKLPPNGGSPLTNMRLRVDNVNYDYPATLGTHVISGLPSGSKKGIVLGVNAIGPSSVWSSQISFTVTAALSPPSAFSYETSGSMVEGQDGYLNLIATGRDPKTYTVVVDGNTYTNDTGRFSIAQFSSGSKTFTGTISNSDGSINISGGFTIAVYKPPTISVTLSPAAPVAGQSVTVNVVVSEGADVEVKYSINGAAPISLVEMPYTIPPVVNGSYVVTATANDTIESAVDSKQFSIVAGAFEDAFDGSGALTDRPGWSLGSGNKNALITVGGSVKHDETLGTIYALSPDMGSVKQKVHGNLTRVLGNVAISGLVACYTSPDDHIRVSVSGGNVIVYTVKGGTATEQASYTGFIPGTNNVSTRNLWFEVYGNLKVFRMYRDGATSGYIAPSTGSETLPVSFSGTKAGVYAFTSSGVFRHNFINHYKTELSTYWNVEATSAPILAGNPVVGQSATYTKGVYTNPSQAVTSQVQRLTGSTWANLQSIAPGGAYTWSAADEGKSTRIAETPTGGVTIYSNALGPVVAASAAGPTITTNSDTDGFAYRVAANSIPYDITPTSYDVRVRPVGSTGAGTVVSGAGPNLNITLPGNGAYEVTSLPKNGGTTGTRSAPSYVWAYKVGDRGYWRGLDAQHCVAAPFSSGSQVIVVPMAARQVTVFEPLPKMKTYTGTGGTSANSPQNWPAGKAWMHGVMKNRNASGGRGPQAWDNRAINIDRNGRGLYLMQGFDLSLAHTAWPDKLALDDTVVKMVSREELSYDRGSDHRAGVVDNLMGLIVKSALPPTNVPHLAGSLFKASTLSQAYVPLTNYNSVLAQIQALQLPITGTVPNTQTIYDKITRGNWQYTLLRGGTHDDDSQEPFSPRFNGFGSADAGNYYQFQLHGVAMALLASNAVSNDWKRDVLQSLLFFGHHADFPGNHARMSAGIAQHHEAPVTLKRFVQGISSADMALQAEQGGQWGNYIGSYFKWTSAMLPMLEKHDNNSWPMFSRRRRVEALVSSPSGRTWWTPTWFTNISGGYGDNDLKQRFAGLEVVQERNGVELQSLPWDAECEGDRRSPGHATYWKPFGVVGTFRSPLQVGDYTFMRIPAQFKPFAGLADWMYASEERMKSNLWTYYNPCPTMSYRNINTPAGWILLMSALGAIPANDPYAAAREYFIRTAQPVGTPNNGWLSYYPGPHQPGADFIGNFWRTHAETLKLRLQDI